MNKAQFQEWLENPVTDLYRRYLKDLADESRKHQKPQLIPHSLDDLISLGSQITEASVQCAVLEDLADLAFEDVERFYQQKEEE